MLHLREWTALLGGESERCLGLAFTHMAFTPVWCKQDGKTTNTECLLNTQGQLTTYSKHITIIWKSARTHKYFSFEFNSKSKTHFLYGYMNLFLNIKNIHSFEYTSSIMNTFFHEISERKCIVIFVGVP